MATDNSSWIRKAGLASSVGLLLVVSTVIGWLIGSWLDKKLGTTPWLTLVFILLGVTAGFIEMIRIVRQISRD